ncbi:MAG TPA: NAD-dependent epimerase/dehydratase family protein [Vicinamibacteria bacterium]|nr:NAD-dependent epimerase/dehydratase family protein [Vicinamibacteria bacterium]
MRALLIGGSGFIGSHVARALEQHGYDVVVFHRGNTVAKNQIWEIDGCSAPTPLRCGPPNQTWSST